MEIKPCPFCWNTTIRKRPYPDGDHDLACNRCGYRSPTGPLLDIIVQHNRVSDAVALARRAEEMLG